MLLKNENASIRLDFVSYEFPETEYGMDEYDKNWLQLRCTCCLLYTSPSPRD